MQSLTVKTLEERYSHGRYFYHPFLLRAASIGRLNIGVPPQGKQTDGGLVAWSGVQTHQAEATHSGQPCVCNWTVHS